MVIFTLFLLTGLAATTVIANPIIEPVVSKRANYVSSISQCPALPKRTATSVHDLRPDQIQVIAAVGDSITAGCFAKGEQSNPLLNLAEWRGVSYAMGGDAGATTLPNLFKHYNPALTGASVGFNIVPEICFGPLCPIGPIGWNSNIDQLNAAQSGAMAMNLLHEVRDYLVPQMQRRGVANAFKYISFQIGSNDLCSLCGAAETGFGPGSPDSFEKHVRETLEYMRSKLPNTIVNVFGVFKVSDIYTLTSQDPYCRDHPDIPHINFLCGCALLGGSAGEYTRGLMDELMTDYNERLLKIVTDYQTANYADFAVLWQPPNVPLGSYPIQSISNVDCFHPSEATHRFIASELWNRLTGTSLERDEAFAWDTTLTFRCLEEGDRFKTKGLVAP